MTKSKKQKIHIFSVVGGVLSFILFFVIAIRTAKATRISTGDAIDRLSNFYIEEFAKGRVSIVSDELEKKKNNINNALKVITQEDLSSPQALRAYLKKIRKLYGVETFALVDENGLVYSGRSTCSGKIRYPFLAEKITAPVYSTVLNYGGEKQLYLAVPVSGLYFNNSKITACFAEINIDQMMSALTYSHENMELFFNLYYKNGESLINSEFGKIEAGQNILSVIKADHEKSSVYNRVKKDFEEGKAGIVDISYEDEKSHIFYTPVQSTGWMLTVLVSDTAISGTVGSSISELMKHTKIHVIITLALVLILFLILILIVRNNSKILVEQEKTVSQKIKYAYEKLNKESQAMQILHGVLRSGPWAIEFDENKKIEKCIWSETFRSMLDFDSEDAFPNKLESWSDRLYKDDKERVLKAFWDTVNDTTGKTIYDVEYRLLTNNNEWKWYHAAGNIIRRADGSPQTFIGLFTDIDDKKRNEGALKEQFSIVNALSRDYATIFRINLGSRKISSIKLEGFVQKFYRKYAADESFYESFFSNYIDERVYSEDKDFMRGAISLENVTEKLKDSIEYASSYRIVEAGEIHFFEFKFTKLNEDTLIVGFMNIDEIVRDAKEKETLIALSETDRMTGLLNRVSGETKIAESLKSGKGGLFILLDVDHFKAFNDTFGHDIGDQVIITVAKALKAAFRENDIVFRLGGDEFSAYASDVHTREIAGEIIGRFMENLKKIDIPELGNMPINASIGATVIEPGVTADFTERYKLIDSAVYESKKFNGSHVTYV